MNAERFFSLPKDLRGALFQRAFDSQPETAAVPSLVIIEKDFWVCWILHQLFHPSPIAEGLVFKGGTSLSKAYDAIQRFSEDVDLTVPTNVAVKGLAIHDTTPAHQRSSIGRQMQAQLRQWSQREFLPSLESRVRNALEGTPLFTEWSLACVPNQPEQIAFRFPPSLPQAEYDRVREMNRDVLLELGARNPVTPSETRSVSPICAPAATDFITDAAISVNVLHGTRTFWEKVTILHELHRRPPERRRAKNYSRHLSDVAVLYSHDLGQEALKNLRLLRTVALDKHRMFYEEHADYAAAARGEVTIVPPASEMRLLQSDYEALSELAYTGERLPFQDAIERVRELERIVRSRAHEIADD